MVLDAVTVRNLELIEPLFAGGRRRGEATLLGVLDQTADRHGRTAAAPAAAAAVDGPRGDRSAAGRGGRAAAGRRSCAPELRKQLGGILDLERLLAKMTLGTAGPRELLALGRSLACSGAEAAHCDASRPRACARSHERAG